MMQKLVSWYRRAADGFCFRETTGRNWKLALILCAVAYIAVLGVRLSDAGKWDHPGLMIGQEHIMGTHDVYFWLSGSQGVGRAAGSAPSELLSFVAKATGCTPGQAAFWLPAFIGALAAAVCCLWGCLLGGRHAGAAAGILGSLAPGLYFRTQVGYYDTDLFTLLMPLTVAWMLAYMLLPHIKDNWLSPSAEQKREEGPATIRVLLLALAFGLFTRFAGLWHMDVIQLNKIFFWTAVFLVVFFGRKGRRSYGIVALSLFAVTAFVDAQSFYAAQQMYSSAHASGSFFTPLFWLLSKTANLFWEMGGMVGVVLGSVLILSFRVWPSKAGSLFGNRWFALGMFLVAVFLCGLLTPAFRALEQLNVYVKPVAEQGGQMAAAAGDAVNHPVFSAIGQSIREARNVPWSEVLGRFIVPSWVGLLGVAGFVFVLFFRPAAVFLLPLLVLGLASVKLGNRFSMFGGPVAAIGLAVSLNWLARRYLPKAGDLVLYGMQAVLIAALLAPWFLLQSKIGPTPVLAKPQAEALLELKKISKPDSMVWTWWDWGYATQYFAGRMTPSDGGDHSGQKIFPTALALTTDSPAQAANMIKYSAAHGNDPASVWEKMDVREVKALVEGFRTGNVKAADIPEQYLVLTWGNMPLLYWTTYYGTWDMETGQGHPYQSERLKKAFKFNPGLGGVMFKDGSKPIPVSSIDLLAETGRKYHSFPNMGPRLVINDVRKDAILLDEKSYRSVGVRLLIGSSEDEDVREHFELVYDGFPHVRIYRVL